MIKNLIKKIIDNKKLFIATITIILLILGDCTVIMVGQLFGSVKGIIFSYKVSDLIVYSNLILIGLAVAAFCYITLDNVKFFRNIKEKIVFFLKNHLKFMRSIKVNLLTSIVFIIITIVIVEFTFYLIPKFKAYPVSYELLDYALMRRDSILGWCGNKNLQAYDNRILINPTTHDTSFVFKTVIRTDSLGNRVIDIPRMQNRKKYAVFFGCSLTFGTGVQDTQVMPYYFAKYDTNFCVYNYAFAGYGTQNMLAKLEYNNLKKSVKQNSGVCFYVFMNGHPHRVIGDMNTYTTFGHNLPYYGYKHDSLYRYGLFSHDRKFVSGFYTMMSKSNFIKYFNINFPLKITPKHYKLTADVIYKSYLEYKKQFHNDNFYVVLYPAYYVAITEYLKKYNIKFIDLSKIFDPNDERYYISIYDRHPSALAHKLFADHLIDAINNLNIKL